MSEITTGIKAEEKGSKKSLVKFSRRSFLKGTGLAAAILTINEAAHEKQLAETGEFETADAIWHPIYEAHNLHERILIPRNIPKKLQSAIARGSSASIHTDNR
jgi:hypothetical protein